MSAVAAARWVGVVLFGLAVACGDGGGGNPTATPPGETATAPPVIDPTGIPTLTPPPETVSPTATRAPTEAPETEPPATEAPLTEAPLTEQPGTSSPTQAPVTDPPGTHPPETTSQGTEPPLETEAPSTEPLPTDLPPTDAPTTQPPPTEAPATDPPATQPPATEVPATPTAVADDDGDGHPAASDCDDGDPEVHPGADEVCNQLDDDCDGDIDDDDNDVVEVPTWYLDFDRDGSGGAVFTLEQCEAPPGYVATTGDCDDTDADYHPGAPEESCSDPNDYNCDGSVGYADADDDGFAACEDCDDASDDVHPGAAERCNGIDDDCDQLVDDADPGVGGQPTWYADADGDGAGDPAGDVVACVQPEGAVSVAGDCDDADPGSYPGADELCDGADNNCDGAVDTGAEDATTWWLDYDKDGYGGSQLSLTQCDAPTGYVAQGGDCDDLSSAVNPGANERCNGIDDNCDQQVDEGAPTDAPTWYGDGDGDGYGEGSDALKACARTTGFVSAAGDCDDSDPTVNPAAEERCDGEDNNCDGQVDDALAGSTAQCAALDCLDVLDQRPGVASGLYYIDPDGEGAGAPFQAHCDMVTDGGGWTLVTKMSQPSAVTNLPESTYNAYFRDQLWIHGVAMARPTSPDASYDTFHIESLRWSSLMKQNERYRLRKTFFREQSDKKHDASWSFTYTGYTEQYGGPADKRAWTLSGRREYTNTTGITFHTPAEITRFWLPLRSGYGDFVYTGCNGYEYSTSGCASTTAGYRRFGNAGIIGSTTDSNDPAAAWAPHMNAVGNYDIVYVHQANTIYGITGARMALLYWLRPDRAAAGGKEICGDGRDNDGDGQVDEGTVGLSEDDPAPHCAGALALCPSGRAADGLYWIDPDGDGDATQAFCDMSTDGGGWTLMAKFTQHQTIGGVTQQTYDAYFKNGLWIEGAAQRAPVSPVPEYDGFHVESHNWKELLIPDGEHELRQTALREYGGLSFDLSWSFVYNGHTSQGPAPESERAWTLSGRRTLKDESGITWHTPTEISRFWLPFKAGYSGGVYTGCNGYQFSSSGCDAANSTYRRFGNAGIIGSATDNNDPASAWAPHMNAATIYDVVYVHQANGVYGATGSRLGLLYWIRHSAPMEVCGDGADNDDDGAIDEAGPGENPSCAAESCAQIRDEDPAATSGRYWVNPDGGSPVQVWCDMTVDGGGWTLCMRNAAQELELALYQSPWGAGSQIVDGSAIGGIGCGRFSDVIEDILWRDDQTPTLRVLANGVRTSLAWAAPSTVYFDSVAVETGFVADPATNGVTFKTGSNHLTHTLAEGKSCSYLMAFIQPYGYCGGGTGYSFVQHDCGYSNCKATTGSGVVEVLVR